MAYLCECSIRGYNNDRKTVKEKKRRNRRTGETEETEEEGFRTGLGAVIMEAPPGQIRVSGIVRWSCHFGREARKCTEDGVWSKVSYPVAMAGWLTLVWLTSSPLVGNKTKYIPLANPRGLCISPLQGTRSRSGYWIGIEREREREREREHRRAVVTTSTGV